MMIKKTIFTHHNCASFCLCSGDDITIYFAACDVSQQLWCMHMQIKISLDIISYPLFADADTGICPHAASQYHARPKAKRCIAMLGVDKFPYPRKQTRGNYLSHAQTIFVTFWNVSAALKSQLSH